MPEQDAMLHAFLPLLLAASSALGAAEGKDPIDTEKALRQIRAQHFRAGPQTERRLEGYEKLRRFRSPAQVELLLEVFEREDTDAQQFLYDHIARLDPKLAATALAWEAVFDEDEADRLSAAELVEQLVRGVDADEPSEQVNRIIAAGLRSDHDAAAGGAAILADRFGLIEAVPMMIAAQVGQPPARTTTERSGPLGFIAITTQRTFVSDLQPVVSDSAVGFDPTLSVVSEGVVLSVDRATVVTYRSEVHKALVRLTSRETGKDTGTLGYDLGRWREWYNRDLRERVEQKLALAANEDHRSDGEPTAVAE